MKLGIVGTGMIVRMVGPNLANWGIDVTAVAGTPRSAAQTIELADAAARLDHLRVEGHEAWLHGLHEEHALRAGDLGDLRHLRGRERRGLLAEHGLVDP